MPVQPGDVVFIHGRRALWLRHKKRGYRLSATFTLAE